MKLFGGIEVGGTKTIVAVVSTQGEILERDQFPTTNAGDTYRRAADFCMAAAETSSLEAIGVGHFGPLSIDPRATNYGQMLRTPKPGWSNIDVRGALTPLFDCALHVDTDVNAALRGELKWGALRTVGDAVYVTVGTGIGAGMVSGGRFVNGRLHPEVGHMLLPRFTDDADFAGSCPFHGAQCAEGLASGPAIAKRWSTEGVNLESDHPAWDLEARYLAALCANLALVIAPQRIVLGGGVMQQTQLFDSIRRRVDEYLRGYPDTPAPDFIVPPGLGPNAGVLGAAAIAIDRHPS